MPKRTNAFQRIITLLNASLAGQAHVQESAMVRDKVTNEEREVDIVITTQAANYKVHIGIEVVAWTRRADTPWVEKMRAKHANLDTDKLILISRSGFTKSAIEKARFYNIEALTLEAACETDWPLFTKLEGEGVFEVTNLKYDCAIVCDFGSGKREQFDAPLNMELSDGKSHVTLNELLQTIIYRLEFREALYPHIKGIGEQDFWFSYTKPEGLFRIQHNGRSGQVEELRVGLKVTSRKTPVQYARGKFQKAAFVAGVSSSVASPLQFVLARTPEGEVKGFLIDDSGVRTLSVCERNGDNHT